MGYTIPPPAPSAADHARALISQKDNIEAEIGAQSSILSANGCTLRSPLVDADGFPRADIDIYAVRNARVRIIELRNDLDAVMAQIARALEGVYDPAAPQPQPQPNSEPTPTGAPEGVPFARVDGVAPGGPAADAGLRREDLFVSFGGLTRRAFAAGSIQPLVDVVAAHENRSIAIKVLRDGEAVYLSLVPRKGWGGRGMLGCHIVPYTSPS